MQEADCIQVRLEARPEQQMVDLALRAIIEMDADAAPAERRAADLGSIGDPDPAAGASSLGWYGAYAKDAPKAPVAPSPLGPSSAPV